RVEERAGSHRDGARDTGLQRPVRTRVTSHQRRLDAVLASHALEDEAGEGWREQARYRVQRFAALLRRRRLWRKRDPALGDRERLVGGHRRPARPTLLQHRYQYL